MTAAPVPPAESPSALLRRAADRMLADAERCGDAPGSFIPRAAALLESLASCGCELGDDHWAQKSAGIAAALAYLRENPS